MAFRLIGVIKFDQTGDHRHHLFDIMRGPGLDVRRQHVHRCEIGMELGGGAGGQRGDIFVVLCGSGGDLVVNVGDVADERHTRIELSQQPGEDIRCQHGPQIADMREIVDRRSAVIDLHMLRIEWLERYSRTALAVVELKFGHRDRSLSS